MFDDPVRASLGRWSRLLFLLVLSSGLAGCAATESIDSTHAADLAAPEPAPSLAIPAFGIEDVQLRRTNHGYLIDFRYRVTDEALARPLLDRKNPIRLVDPASGGRYKVIGSPKVGPLRNTTGMPVEGRVYYVLFANPGAALEAGDTLAIEIGPEVIEGLVLVD